MDSNKKKRGSRFTDTEMEYLVFTLDEHLKLLESNLSIPWEDTFTDQRKHVKLIKDKLPLLKKRGSKPKEIISEEDFFFIEFSMDERSSFMQEGIVSPWKGKTHSSDIARQEKLLHKLRRVLGLKGSQYSEITPALFE